MNNGKQRLTKAEVIITDMVKDIMYLKASFEKINAELGMVNQQLATMKANYEWVKWISIAVLSVVIPTAFRVWMG